MTFQPYKPLAAHQLSLTVTVPNIYLQKKTSAWPVAGDFRLLVASPFSIGKLGPFIDKLLG